MSKKIYNVINGRKGPDDKTFWSKHGVLVVNGDKISIKLESIPIGEWNGWFSCFLPSDDQNKPQHPDRTSQAIPKANLNDDLPF